VFQRRALGHYKETRNGLLGHDYSSKFSPWLAQGSLSARQVHAAVRDYERQFGSNASTYWLVFELLWRDFFEFTAARHGPALYWRGGIQRKTRAWRHALADFQRWCQGESGDDFVDAGLRELATSGYLSNRARQNVASFLVHELGIDWRWGAAWFEHHLLDYAPASNYGNWQYIAGVGNDPRPLRRFDTQAQAQRYDASGSYRAQWLDAAWQTSPG
jgi:deoxyribodipyrimidine photo-lyase